MRTESEFALVSVPVEDPGTEAGSSSPLSAEKPSVEPSTCQHLRTTRVGSNAYQKVIKCKDCGYQEVTRFQSQTVWKPRLQILVDILMTRRTFVEPLQQRGDGGASFVAMRKKGIRGQASQVCRPTWSRSKVSHFQTLGARVQLPSQLVFRVLEERKLNRLYPFYITLWTFNVNLITCDT